MGRLHRHDDGVAHTHVDSVAAPELRKTPLGDHSGYATGRERVQVLERIFARTIGWVPRTVEISTFTGSGPST